MSKSDVFWVPAKQSDAPIETEQKLARLWKAAEFQSLFSANDLVPIKLHVGEPGCVTFLPPSIGSVLAKFVAKRGARPFFTDTAVLYKSRRNNAVDHMHVAHEHGFGLGKTAWPFFPADGLCGTDEIEVPIAGKHFKTVAIASTIVQARSMLVLSHAKGHLGTGLGGTLKNLGMGCSSRKGKLKQHHGQAPNIKAKYCTGCGVCAEWCPSEAIAVGKTAKIDKKRCIGCGECIAMCRQDAIATGWGILGQEIQERIVEHAAGAIKNKKNHIGYVNVLQTITKDCDCLAIKQQPLMDDIGFLASKDPVALDQATLDLIAQKAGQSLESMSYPGIDAGIQIKYAAHMGLGNQEFQLVAVDG